MWAIAVITLAATSGVTLGQSYHPRSSQDAAILSDARYLAGDGTFGAAYSQEDGVEFKEESDANGDRRGSYSYVDPTGARRTVFYTAGKNGFQVRDELEATGDHIPTARPVVAPQPEYEPLPQYNPPDYRPPQRRYRAQTPLPPPPPPQSHYAQESIYQPEPQYDSRPQYRPPPPQPPQYRPPQPPPPQPQYRPEPQQPQYRPQPRPQYRPPPLLAYQQPEPENPPQFQYPSRPQYHQPSPRPQYNEITTPAPRRFYPPGKLDFNRTPDGFSYTFSKN